MCRNEKCVKRGLDITCSLLAFVLFGWMIVFIALVVRIRLGSPVIFKQPRSGMIGADGKEKIFTLYKFRTITNEVGEDGSLLPDEVRLTRFGKWLRSRSLDGNVIIGQTTENLVNKGFREVSPIHFFTGRDLFFRYYNDFHASGEECLAA